MPTGAEEPSSPLPPRNGRHFYLHFYLADRGTMPVVRKGLTQTSFARKLLAYQETWRRGLHKMHLGIPNFRVLTVTTSRERVRHLVAACRSLPGGGSHLFLFADEGATWPWERPDSPMGKRGEWKRPAHAESPFPLNTIRGCWML